MTHPPSLPNGFSRDFSEVRDALKSAIRAAKMAMFIHDRREHPNDNWRHGINADLAVAEKMAAEMGAPVQAPVDHQYRAGELIIDIDCQAQAKSVGWEASPTTTATGVRWVIKGDLASALLTIMAGSQETPKEITAWQIAYAALWQIQSSTPALHDARKHLLTVIGGRGSEQQKTAIAWAMKHLPEPMNLDPHEAPACWDEIAPIPTPGDAVLKELAEEGK